MPSYSALNYHQRPAKSIERKIFVELVKEIFGVSSYNQCSYIGMGSVFYPDFKLIHRELGLNNMINIEENEDDKYRFEFNKPFSCIQLKWGASTEVLPRENWLERKIIWLDYDKSLKPYMFDDIDIIFTNIVSESFYFMSCNSALPSYLRHNGDHNINGFQSDFDGLFPETMNAMDLTRNNSSKLIYKMILSRIQFILESRNATLTSNEKLIFHQMLYINYQDGAPMISIGGYVIKKKDYFSFKKQKVNKLKYIRQNDIPLDIITAIVTNQELDLMNKYLPNSPKKFCSLKKLQFIPHDEKENYHSSYRFYPHFFEIRE